METEYIWHGRRYWIQEPKGNQHQGWNTRFEPCVVLKKTAKRIVIESPSFGTLHLNRIALEVEGKAYHSRFGEYFYHSIPAVDPEKARTSASGWREFLARQTAPTNALRILGLSAGCSAKEIKRAYKRLARKHHPDSGGSHESFIELQAAYETAIKAM